MGGFTLKGVGADTELPQRTGIRGDARHVGQPVLTEKNIMDWGGGLVFPKSLKARALDSIALGVRFSKLQKGPECLVHMSRQTAKGKNPGSSHPPRCAVSHQYK